MCGICGIINLDDRPIDRSVLEAMNRTMVHRGPDGEGYFANAKGIGQRPEVSPSSAVALLRRVEGRKAERQEERKLGRAEVGHRRYGDVKKAGGMWGWGIGD